MKPTKETTIAINAIATLAVATSVVMGATFILFYYLDYATGIKDAWSTIAGFFGGFATLTAAYIASKFFNDWRVQENHIRSQNLYDQTLSVIYNSTNIIEDILINLREINSLKKIKGLSNNIVKNKITKLLEKNSILIRKNTDRSFELIAVIGMDYNNSIKTDKKLKQLFEIVLIINQKFRKYSTREEILNFKDLNDFHDSITEQLDTISESNMSEFNHYFD